MFVMHLINNNYDDDYIKLQDLEIRVQLPYGFDLTDKDRWSIQLKAVMR